MAKSADAYKQKAVSMEEEMAKLQKQVHIIARENSQTDSESTQPNQRSFKDVTGKTPKEYLKDTRETFHLSTKTESHIPEE